MIVGYDIPVAGNDDSGARATLRLLTATILLEELERIELLPLALGACRGTTGSDGNAHNLWSDRLADSDERIVQHVDFTRWSYRRAVGAELHITRTRQAEWHPVEVRHQKGTDGNTEHHQQSDYEKLFLGHPILICSL